MLFLLLAFSKLFRCRIHEEFKECIALLLNDGLFENVKKQVIMIFVYISPEGSFIYNDENDNGIERLFQILTILRNECNDYLFYLAGDFNARTKNLLDYIPDDSLHYIFGDIDYNSDYFNLPRLNKDKKFNAFGKSLVEMCCNFDVHILNGRLFKDREGHYYLHL